MTLRSSSLCCFNLEKSWLNAVWMTPSAASAAVHRRSRFVHVAAEDLRPGTGERLGVLVRTAEPDHVMAGADQFRDDRRAYETCSTLNQYAHVPILCFVNSRHTAHCPLLARTRAAGLTIPSRLARPAVTISCAD
jgi:hypothetical protein